MRSGSTRPDVGVFISVPSAGEITIRAPGMPRAGKLGPVTLAVCAACLPEGEYEIAVCAGRLSATATPREPSRIEEAYAKLGPVSNEVLELATA